MPTDCIAFKQTGFFSSLICDYLDEIPELHALYNHFPTLENFKKQIKEKQSFYKGQNRNVLTTVLEKQYINIGASQKTLDNLELLNQENTFTITTGHQLNLFTGPVYFIYKIVSTINLAKQLKDAYPKYNFVPVYWMATEDHDFEEINFFNFHGAKIHWNSADNGAVGRFSTEGLEDVLQVFSAKMDKGFNSEFIKSLFKKAYIDHGNLAEATRFLVNELFKDYGLVIVDGDNKDLKKIFSPYIEKEIIEQISFKEVSKTNKLLNAIPDKNYNVQVNPREINLFYVADGLRERIVKKDLKYSVLHTDISWNASQLQEEIYKHPDRFSPNVLTRPLYQEVLLPNLCYIGGGGELAYWLQLKSYFDSVEVPFPILLLRNSVLIQTEKQAQKMNKLNISNLDMFMEKHALINKKVRQVSNIDIDFSKQKEHLQQQFKSLFQLAELTDKSFLGAVAAQERKQIKGLEHLEKRLLKAQKRKLVDHVERVSDLKDQLFPNGQLQERTVNFSEFYLEFGEGFIPTLIKYLQPLRGAFLVLSL